jgi:hypothetical protein
VYRSSAGETARTSSGVNAGGTAFDPDVAAVLFALAQAKNIKESDATAAVRIFIFLLL